MTERPQNLASKRIVVVGVGGVGAPALLTLVEAGARNLLLVDDDTVEVVNLHRQILFAEDDVGRPKLRATRDALVARAPDVGLRIDLCVGRALPMTALDIVRGADAVLDATDNFASRFLLADACFLAGVPVVHAAAVRWTGTVMAVAARGAPCYRCLFEDLPEGEVVDCATAGILGPVCGVVGAIAGEMAIRLALGHESDGQIATYDGLSDELRLIPVSPRPSCALCGAEPKILDLDESRYVSPACAA